MGGTKTKTKGIWNHYLCLLVSLQRLSTISQQMPECWSQLQEYAASLKRKMFGEVSVQQELRLVSVLCHS